MATVTIVSQQNNVAFEKANGEMGTKHILTAKVRDFATKQEVQKDYAIHTGSPVYKKLLESPLTPGQQVEMVWTKDPSTGYSNLTDIGPPKPKSDYKGGGGYKKADYPEAKDLSQEISGLLQGFVGTGCPMDQLEQRVYEVLAIKDRIMTNRLEAANKKMLPWQKLEKPAEASVQPPQQAQAPVQGQSMPPIANAQPVTPYASVSYPAPFNGSGSYHVPVNPNPYG